MNDRFWMVWNPEGNSPKHQHWSRESASAEARRLASLNPSTDFYVLEAVGFARKVDVEYRQLDCEVPF